MRGAGDAKDAKILIKTLRKEKPDLHRQAAKIATIPIKTPREVRLYTNRQDIKN